MTGYDLRLWRKSLCWSRERAAAELGVSLRTYKDYETSKEVKRSIALATVTLSLIDTLPTLQQPASRKTFILRILEEMTSQITTLRGKVGN
jgi:transcriptional regulator with XRE-family HTH domain